MAHDCCQLQRRQTAMGRSMFVRSRCQQLSSLQRGLAEEEHHSGRNKHENNLFPQRAISTNTNGRLCVLKLRTKEQNHHKVQEPVSFLRPNPLGPLGGDLGIVPNREQFLRKDRPKPCKSRTIRPRV